jgi:dolichol-phosphate mannosyltransferase
MLPQSCVVVLPTRNEADAIVAVLSEVQQAAEILRGFGCTSHVIVVDDASADGTVDLAREFARVTALSVEIRPGPSAGLGAAVLDGVRLASDRKPDVIVCLDADGQHDARDVPTLLRAHFARRSDITIGSRWTRGGQSPGTSTLRLLGSRTGNLLFRSMTGTRHVSDATTAFRVLSPRAAAFLLDSGLIEYRGYAFFSGCIALADGAGLSISEVPITFRPRYGGVSKLTAAEVRRFFASLSRMRVDRRSQVAGRGTPGFADGGASSLQGVSTGCQGS